MCRFGCGLMVPAGWDVRLQPSQQRCHLHRIRHFTNPHMHAGLQLIKMSLHAKAGLLHEVGREKAIDGGHDPGMLFDVAIAEPKLGYRNVLSGFHLTSINSYVEGILSGCGTEPEGLRTPA